MKLRMISLRMTRPFDPQKMSTVKVYPNQVIHRNTYRGLCTCDQIMNFVHGHESFENRSLVKTIGLMSKRELCTKKLD